MNKLIAFCFTISTLVVTAISAQASEVRLLMFEAAGCTYCEQWDQEIGVFYSGTEEGKWAPLRRVDDDVAWPEELLHIKGVVYTPTFVVTKDNVEVGRITGYPGEDYFWGYLTNMLKQTGFEPN